MSIRDEDMYIYTADYAFATFLYCHFSNVNILKEDDGRVWFVFERNKDTQTMVELYRTRQARIEPQTYFQNLKMVKNWIYEEQGV